MVTLETNLQITPEPAVLYTTIKTLHVTTAVLTVSMFSLRVVLDMAGYTAWRNTVLRWLPHLNDTILLTAGLYLLTVGPWSPLQHWWLAVKLILVVLYIFIGGIALKAGAVRSRRIMAAVLALLIIVAIVILARLKPL